MNNNVNSCKVSNLIYIKATKRIKCWKIFKIENGKYYGPFTNYEFSNITEGKYISPSIISDISFSFIKRFCPALYNVLFNKLNKRYPRWFGQIWYDSDNKWWNIMGGFIHTLCYKPDELKSYCPDWGTYELWECEIPIGTVYFQANRRGSHYECNNSYASKEIKLIKKLSSITI